MKYALALMLLFVAAATQIWLGNDLYRWWQARSWQPVTTELLQVELKENRSDDSTTWQVQAQYQYDFGGRQWQSERVAIAQGADNIGDFQKRLHAQLYSSWQQQQPVTAWVNPNDPQQAVLNRELRFGVVALKAIFPLAFGGFGVAVLLLGRRHKKRADDAPASSGNAPHEPWRQRQQWQSSTLLDAGRSSWITALVMALIWNAISLPLLFLLPDEIRAGNHAALLGLLFPLIGVGLMVWAVRNWRRWRRYGQSRLHLDAMPVALGGVLRATLEIPAKLSSRQLHVQLLCLHRTVSGTGKNRHSSESMLWENRYDVPLQAGSSGTRSARVVIPLPDNQPESVWQNERSTVIWHLSANASEPGVDYASEFELPVFAVDTEPLSGEVNSDLPPEQPGLWRDTGVQHAYTSQGQRFYWPRYRLLSAGLWTLLAALLFGGIGVFMLLQQAWLMGGVFTLVALPILWGAITMLFQRSEIIIGQGQCRYSHGVFAGEKVLPLAEVRQLTHQRSGSIGKRTFYRLDVQLWGSERSIHLADWLPGERQTTALVQHLQALL